MIRYPVELQIFILLLISVCNIYTLSNIALLISCFLSFVLLVLILVIVFKLMDVMAM
jgi:hypothetical protein